MTAVYETVTGKERVEFEQSDIQFEAVKAMLAKELLRYR